MEPARKKADFTFLGSSKPGIRLCDDEKVPAARVWCKTDDGQLMYLSLDVLLFLQEQEIERLKALNEKLKKEKDQAVEEKNQAVRDKVFFEMNWEEEKKANEELAEKLFTATDPWIAENVTLRKKLNELEKSKKE